MKDHLSRKSVIINLLSLPLAASAVALTGGQASAAATMEQKAALYQSKPKNGQQCSGCSLYIPAKSDPTKSNGNLRKLQLKGSDRAWGLVQVLVEEVARSA